MASGGLSPRGVRCHFIDDALALQFGDGMSTIVPMEIIKRSNLLHASVTETFVEDGWVLDAPGRFVRDWLECLSFLGITPPNQSTLETIRSNQIYSYLQGTVEHYRACRVARALRKRFAGELDFPNRLGSFTPEMVLLGPEDSLGLRSADRGTKSFMQACDYLADEEAVETIRKYLGEKLFQTCSDNLQHRRISGTNEEPSSVKDFHEGLTELSDDLAISVLHASPASLDYQLESLPETLHHLALNAAFPTLLSDGVLSLDCSHCSLETATAVLKVFPRVGTQTRLHIRSLHPEAVPGSQMEAFFNSLDDAVRSGPSEVQIEHVNMPAPRLQSLLVALVGNTCLQSLKVSSMYVHYYPSLANPENSTSGERRHVNVPSMISANISDLANLRQLVLRNDASSDDIAAERVLVHSMQLPTLLTLLDFDHFGPVDAEVLSSMIPSLAALKSLCLCFWADSDPIADRLSASIATLTMLTSLTLAEKDSLSAWDPDRAHRVLPCLKHLQALQELDLAGCIMDRSGVAHVLTAMPHICNLQRLSLKVTAVGTVTIALLESLITTRRCSHLSIEAVWQHLPDAVRGELICERLRTMTCLQSLRLKSCSVSDTPGRGINETLSILTDLTHLCLSQVFSIEPTTGIALSALGRLKKLQLLELDDFLDKGRFGQDEDTDRVPDGLFQTSFLRTVHLQMYQFPLQLAAACFRLTCLTELRMVSCFFDRGAYSPFCTSLAMLTTLRHLSLTGLSQRTSQGYIASDPLMSALRNLTQLKSLTIARCGFDFHNNAVRNVLQGVACLTTLTYLSLKRLALYPSHSDDIVVTLSSLSRLEVLILASCDVGDTCISAVAEGISILPRLRVLDLTENRITDQGAESLATALYAVVSLRQVLIEQSQIREEGAKALLASVGHRDPTRCLELVTTCRNLLKRWTSYRSHPTESQGPSQTSEDFEEIM